MRYVLGIDIGGTNIVIGAVTEDGGTVRGLLTEPTGVPDGSDVVIDRILRMAERVIAKTRAEDPHAEVRGVGIGAPGPLNRKKGLVIFTPNLHWTNMPLRDRIGNALKLPASLDNDANCALLGEHWVGAARGRQNAVCFTIGTGIGGGIVVDGKLVHGASDVAGEIGHITIEVNGRRCGCGNDGCLEAYASGPPSRDAPSRPSRPARYPPWRARRGTSRRSPRKRCSSARPTEIRWPTSWCATPPATSASASRTCSTS